MIFGRDTFSCVVDGEHDLARLVGHDGGIRDQMAL